MKMLFILAFYMSAIIVVLSWLVCFIIESTTSPEESPMPYIARWISYLASSCLLIYTGNMILCGGLLFAVIGCIFTAVMIPKLMERIVPLP